MNQYRNVIVWVILAAAAVIYIWLNNDQDTNIDTTFLFIPDDPPDVFITGMDLTRYGADGAPVLNAKAESLSVYKETKQSLMTRPIVVLSNPEEETWRVTAEKAVIHTNEDIEFISNVLSVQLNATPSVVVASDYMNVTNQGSLIETDKPVRIVKGKQVINAIGMEVKLDTIKPVIHLLSEVSFTYDPF